ncbi:NAD-dependent epimerase [Synechococcus sp. MIT S9452]|uniref:NAD-dependent epimerase n=1 Tax=Synechococcus sp. MIT S9452 TaxID=3082546 RepID=UPI0039A773D8
MISKVIVTGAAGFIGAAVSERLLSDGVSVVGVDNLNSYYDRTLKLSRLKRIESINKNLDWSFLELDIADQAAVHNLFRDVKPSAVVHLAAQAGVRYSLQNPSAYIQSNLVGFGHILEGCREQHIEHLVYASSSSVYGGNKNVPFQETQAVDHPVSLYAASKKANELMAHSYSHLYGFPATGLRFFTVYGPWGRPDMAPMLFANAILKGLPIKVFNNGNMSRDFTFIDDIVEGIVRVLAKPATPSPDFNSHIPDSSCSWAPHRIFNIGNSSPTSLLNFIEALEVSLGITAIKQFEPMQPGDVQSTAADTRLLESWIGFSPSTHLSHGIDRFTRWYRDYYGY